MVCQQKKLFVHIATRLFLIVSISLIFGNLVTIGLVCKGNQSEGKIAVFYGSDIDKQLSEKLVGETDREADYYNITTINANSSFSFNNNSVVAIWWINELSLPVDLNFIGDINDWKTDERGLFVLNRYFNETPLQDLNHLGIKTYAPIVYPLNGSYQKHEINLVEENFSFLNLTEKSFEFQGSSAWVKVDSRVELLAKITVPESEPILVGLTSGIWLKDNRVVVGSFSLTLDGQNLDSRFKLHDTNINTPENILDLLSQVAELSLGTLEDNGGLIQLGGIEELVMVGLVGVSITLAFLASIKIGVISKIREVFMSIFMGVIFFFAHITYSPQKRRLNEDDLLSNELRTQILEYLEQKGGQGAHLREIQRELGCGISSLLWHLQALDDFNLVTHEKIGKYHIFYLMGEKSIQTSEIALALKSNVAKELCRVLIRNKKPLSLSRISQEIDVHHSSVQHHIKKLSDLGIIVILQEKKRSSYAIASKRASWLKVMLEVA
jgi:predicted transcriptional regulator